MKKKCFILALFGILSVKAMTGCGTVQNTQNGDRVQIDAASSQTFEEPSSEPAACAMDSGEADTNENCLAEQFAIYEPYGMAYDAEKNKLYYKGKAVRWFEDYYPLLDDSQAGRDFFDEEGVVDVYAVRDRSSMVRAEDGSFDPGGSLTGLEEFSEEVFAARDLDAIRNPAPITAETGEPASQEELRKMAEEYAPFGVTYDMEDGAWYFHGEKVRYFRDILTSNGESLSGGRFHGTMRTFGSEDGTVDIYIIRDYEKLNGSGYGTITGVETCGKDSDAIERPGNVDMTVYEPYGLIFDNEKECYTYHGSIVRHFNDWRSGAGFTNFATGTVDIEAEYDGNHQLIGIAECSKEMYDYHTNKMRNWK